MERYLKYFCEFGITCFILNDREQTNKFYTKSDEGIFLGYSLNSRAYRVYNKRAKTIMELVNVLVDYEEANSSTTWVDDS